MPVLATNKRANFDYEILETFEAGLVLAGHEVKSIRAGNASLKGAYVVFERSGGFLPTPVLLNAHIPLYKYASLVENYDPEHSRKLLLNKNEIARLLGKTKEKGLTLVALRLYTKNRFLKLEFGLARGKKQYDKREDIKKRETDRYAKRALKGENVD